MSIKSRAMPHHQSSDETLRHTQFAQPLDIADGRFAEAPLVLTFAAGTSGYVDLVRDTANGTSTRST